MHINHPSVNQSLSLKKKGINLLTYKYSKQIIAKQTVHVMGSTDIIQWNLEKVGTVMGAGAF